MATGDDRGWRGVAEAVREFSLELFSFKISPLGFLWDVGRRVIQPDVKFRRQKSSQTSTHRTKKKVFQWEIKSKKHLAIKKTVIKIIVSYISVSYKKRSVERDVIR